MQCKKCQTELQDDCTVCPNCGEEISTGISSQLKFWRIAFGVAAGLMLLVLLALLAGLVNYGATGSFLPRPNDIFNKNSYSFAAEQLDTPGGNKSFVGKMDKVVATMGEHKLTNQTLQMYYWEMVKNSKYVDMDTAKPLDEQIQDPDTGKTWQQFFIEKALEEWKRDMILVDRAKAAGFQMPADYQTQFDNLKVNITKAAQQSGFASADAMIQEVYGPGVDFDSYYQYEWNYRYGALYLADMVEKAQFTEAELETYFQENEQSLKTGFSIPVTKDSGKMIDVRHILVGISGGTKDEDGKTVYSEEDWENCRKKAQALLDGFLAGEKTEDAFAELAVKNSEDGGSASKGGLYEFVSRGEMVEPFDNWCFDETRKPGDTGLVKTEFGYHVMYFVYGEEGWIRICTDGLKNQKTDNQLKVWVDAAEMKVNYRAIVLAELELSSSR